MSSSAVLMASTISRRNTGLCAQPATQDFELSCCCSLNAFSCCVVLPTDRNVISTFTVKRKSQNGLDLLNNLP